MQALAPELDVEELLVVLLESLEDILLPLRELLLKDEELDDDSDEDVRG